MFTDAKCSSWLSDTSRNGNAESAVWIDLFRTDAEQSCATIRRVQKRLHPSERRLPLGSPVLLLLIGVVI